MPSEGGGLRPPVYHTAPSSAADDRRLAARLWLVTRVLFTCGVRPSLWGWQERGGGGGKYRCWTELISGGAARSQWPCEPPRGPVSAERRRPPLIRLSRTGVRSSATTDDDPRLRPRRRVLVAAPRAQPHAVLCSLPERIPTHLTATIFVSLGIQVWG